MAAKIEHPDEETNEIIEGCRSAIEQVDNK